MFFPVKKTNPLAVALQGLAGFGKGFVEQKNREEQKKEQERIRQENMDFQRQMAEEARAWQQQNIEYNRAWEMFTQVDKYASDLDADAPPDVLSAVNTARTGLLEALKSKDWKSANSIFSSFSTIVPEIQQYSKTKKEEEHRNNIADQLMVDAVRNNDPVGQTIAELYRQGKEIPADMLNSRTFYVLALKDGRYANELASQMFDENGNVKPEYSDLKQVAPVIKTAAEKWKAEQEGKTADQLKNMLSGAVQTMAKMGITDPVIMDAASEALLSEDPAKVREALSQSFNRIAEESSTDQQFRTYANVANMYISAGVPVPEGLRDTVSSDPFEAVKQASNAAIHSKDDDAAIKAAEQGMNILAEYAADIQGAGEVIEKFTTAATKEEKARAAREMAPYITEAINKASEYAKKKRLFTEYRSANEALQDAIRSRDPEQVAVLQAAGLVTPGAAKNAREYIDNLKFLEGAKNGGELAKLVSTFSPIVVENNEARLLSASELEQAIQDRLAKYEALLKDSNPNISEDIIKAGKASLRSAMTAAWYEAKKDMSREARANRQLALQEKQYALSERRMSAQIAGNGASGSGMSASELRNLYRTAMDKALEVARGANCAAGSIIGGGSKDVDWLDTTSDVCAPIYADYIENYTALQSLSEQARGASAPSTGQQTTDGGNKNATPQGTSKPAGIVPPGTKKPTGDDLFSGVPREHRPAVEVFYNRLMSGKDPKMSKLLDRVLKGDITADELNKEIASLARRTGYDPNVIKAAYSAAYASKKKDNLVRQLPFGAIIKPGTVPEDKLMRVVPAIKVVEERTGLPGDATLALMWLETNRTLNPSVNRKGLFQLVNHGNVGKLPPEKQAEVFVDKYLGGTPDNPGNPVMRRAIQEYKEGKIDFGKLYLSHFLPSYYDKPKDTKLPDEVLRWNPLFKKNPTVGGVIETANRYYNEIMEKGNGR